MFRGDVAAVLGGLSSVCVLILLGLYLYSGTFLPSTEGAGRAEAAGLWLTWTVLVLVPIATLLDLIVRIARR